VVVEVVLGQVIRFTGRKTNGKKCWRYFHLYTHWTEKRWLQKTYKKCKVKGFINKYKYRIGNKKKSGYCKRGR
jgi:hypothetical protein